MIYGIAGNSNKEKLWEPVAGLIRWLHEQRIGYRLHPSVAEGLLARRLAPEAEVLAAVADPLAGAVDVALSFGGDGTLLHTAHEIGTAGVPILGVNIGRLGFLADIEVADLPRTIARLEAGDYRIDERLVLQAEMHGGPPLKASWALNEFVVERTGTAKLIAIDVAVDGVPLNTYWADGLIVATPTGSTAYSLAAGGPLMMPGCGVMLLTPISPHMLTVRPLVIPSTSVIEIDVRSDDPACVLAADGISNLIESADLRLIIKPAPHQVRLVKLPEQHYFHTIRSKLMWGVRNEKND